MCHSFSQGLKAFTSQEQASEAWQFMNRMLKTGVAVMSAIAMTASPIAFAQTAPGASSSESGSASGDSDVSNEDIMNVAIVCVATYDLVLADAPAGPQTEKIREARTLARSIYMEASGNDDTKADAEISGVDAALKEEVTKGTMKLDELRGTCDSLLMDDTVPPPTAS
ncbi:hypothetical protein AEAC466_10235 [Asticcacaulis sp. AC466]|uniref:hypothetical protein n=1 Tax=Asticcacaulis sp. AC466 TaxID=1282362 RepID=UPI0003C3B48F|nr:hypothetical protein [Asticcacaulis sp. AC466]ESQ84115.1 hypothetical protein AEAC466_10235 [Asticcacaulis sp. AC466]